ncbi:MAG: AAA family ATPase [Bacteroidetes bacterium]|nr:AAA family ATPase [Bacteroidota bacterium]
MENNQERPAYTPKFINPDINVDALQAEAERLFAYDNTKKGLLTVMKGNKWLQQASQRPIPRMLFSQFWHEGELCILFADTNTGKSILAVQIAESISRGVPVPGWKLDAAAQPVIYIDFELHEKQFEARYSDNYTRHYEFHDNFERAELNPDSEVTDDFEEQLLVSLEQTVIETGVRILVIDNMTYLKNETERAHNALPLMKQLKALKTKYNLSILALAHTPKRDMSKPITRNDLSGSKMLMSFCDSSFCIGESTTDKSLRYLKQIKARNTEIVFDSNNVCLCRIEKPNNFLQFCWQGYAKEQEHLRESEERDREWLIEECKRLAEENPDWTQREIAEELGISAATVNRALKE